MTRFRKEQEQQPVDEGEGVAESLVWRWGRASKCSIEGSYQRVERVEDAVAKGCADGDGMRITVAHPLLERSQTWFKRGSTGNGQEHGTAALMANELREVEVERAPRPRARCVHESQRATVEDQAPARAAGPSGPHGVSPCVTWVLAEPRGSKNRKRSRTAAKHADVAGFVRFEMKHLVAQQRDQG